MPARRKVTKDIPSIDNRIRANSEWSCLTEAEAAAHDAFVTGLGDGAVWKRFG